MGVDLWQTNRALTAACPNNVRELQMSSFRRRRIVVVICAVVVSYRCIDEFINVHAIQAVDPNCVKLAAEVRTFSPPEGADTTLLAEHMVDVVGLVINEL
jgi:hypothetical protein